MIIQKIKEIPIGTVIPKPQSKHDFTISHWGIRRSQEALIYNIPNQKNPDKPFKKGVTIEEFKHASEHLVQHGDFTRKWFNKHLEACAYEGGCNFTTIGGIFVLIGIAKYTSTGTYLKI